MKEKLKKLVFSPAVRNGLCACMALSWWISAKYASILFFGERTYPVKEDFE